MKPELLQSAALCAAFWTAVILYRGDRPLRFAAALGLGAVGAHLGWALLHAPLVWDQPWLLVDPSRGYAVLFVPIVVWSACPGPRTSAALPAALAVARLGCLAVGCCHGRHGEPIPWLEISGLLALHACLPHLDSRRHTPVVLTGTALLRGLGEPWRAGLV